MLYKRGKVWWARYKGKRVSTGCTDRKAAQLTVAEWERRDASPAYAAAAETTVGDAYDWMITNLRNLGRAEATLEYRSRKAGHLLRIFGEETPIAAVTAETVDKYIAQRREEGVTRHTISKELSTLRMMLFAAKRRKKYPHDLDEVMPQGFSTGHEPKRRSLTPDELTRLLGTLKPHRAAWVAFCVATGARLGEVRRARRQDVDLKRGLVRLRGTKTEKADRLVPITPMTLPLLERALASADGTDGLLFSRWKAVHDGLQKACRRIGIESVSPNDLRRTLATWLRTSGVDTSIVAEVMGHTDSRMVERVYARLEGEKLRDALLDALGGRYKSDTVAEKGTKNPAEFTKQEGPTTPIGEESPGGRKTAFPAENKGSEAAELSAEPRTLRPLRYKNGTVAEPPADRRDELLREIDRRLRPLAKIAAAFRTPRAVGGAS